MCVYISLCVHIFSKQKNYLEESVLHFFNLKICLIFIQV